MENGLYAVDLSANQDLDLVEIYSDDTIKCVATQEIADKFNNELCDVIKNNLIHDFHSQGAARDSGYVCSCDDLWHISLNYEYHHVQSLEERVPFQKLYIRIIQLRFYS